MLAAEGGSGQLRMIEDTRATYLAQGRAACYLDAIDKAASRHAFVQHPAFARPVVDTTGAGDTFNAAFLVAMLEGQSLQAGLRFACAAASHAVTAVGARSGMPDRATVDRAVAAQQTNAAVERPC